MISIGNKELSSINDNIYFYSLPLFLKSVVYIIILILMLFVAWSAINLVSQNKLIFGYILASVSILTPILTFILIFRNKSFGRYFGLDEDGMYFNNYKNKKKWLFVPWNNVFHVKEETYYISRSYVIELSLLSNKYEMAHYFRMNGDPFWDEKTGKIKIAYSRIPFQNRELLSYIVKYCSHCSG